MQVVNVMVRVVPAAVPVVAAVGTDGLIRRVVEVGSTFWIWNWRMRSTCMLCTSRCTCNRKSERLSSITVRTAPVSAPKSAAPAPSRTSLFCARCSTGPAAGVAPLGDAPESSRCTRVATSAPANVASAAVAAVCAGGVFGPRYGGL
jgi:hypothetical protein